MTKISRALVSAYDKTGIGELARALHQRGVTILSTGGTAKTIEEAGVPVTQIADVTGFPEMLDGRVKTLHPKIHAALLARREDPSHRAQLEAHEIEPIDLVCVNLYPFVDTVAREGVTEEEAIEQIDIGGPCMLRAAAKNHRDVVPLVDPADYAEVLQRLDEGKLDLDFRRSLAQKAFSHTAVYDAAVANYLGLQPGAERLPDALVVGARKTSDLRYGENPHQAAALYCSAEGEGIAGAVVLNGKPLSFNNLQDAEGAYDTVQEFDGPAAVVVKHANPCGAAVAADPVAAFRAAWAGDPVSAFGGILAFNREVSGSLAEAIAEPGRFVEVIVAPAYQEEALRVLREKPKWGTNVRILACAPPSRSGYELRQISGGFLAQEWDAVRAESADLKVVTQREPTEEEVQDLVFAQRCAKHVKSNAIVLVRGEQIVGVGAGQMSRVDASRMAVQKAGDRAQGAVFASDAFLPFNDALEVAVDAGVRAAVQPGGSRNDEACIRYVDEKGLAMVFTGTRHFLH